MKFRKVAVLTLIGAMAMSMTAFADSESRRQRTSLPMSRRV